MLAATYQQIEMWSDATMPYTVVIGLMTTTPSAFT